MTTLPDISENTAPTEDTGPEDRPVRIAILGRPNVGKSTLFNRIVGRRAALVHDQPGMTRDRRELAGRLSGLPVVVIDTAGLEEADDDALETRMRSQSLQAARESDVAVFLVDARAGVTPADREFAGILRRAGVPVVLAANKCEGRAVEAGIHEAWELGLGEPIPISAEHNLGMSDLELAIKTAAGAAADRAQSRDGATEEERALSLAIVGRPNAGKSTLMNRLLGEERMITGPEPGITRDSISIDWAWQGRPVRLIDTAGIRRRAKVDEGAESLSVMDSFRAIRFADVVAIMVDATTVQDFGYGIEKQDLTIARQVEEEGRALVIVANKWDLVEDRRAVRQRITESLETSLSQLKGVPLVTISALEGDNLERLMPAVFETYDAWNLRVSTSRLNRWLEEAVDAFPPPLDAGRRVRIRFMTQPKARPPTFVLWVNKPAALPDSYLRYLTNRLRESFGFAGVPLRLALRKPKNPYVDDGGS